MRTLHIIPRITGNISTASGSKRMTDSDLDQKYELLQMALLSINWHIQHSTRSAS